LIVRLNELELLGVFLLMLSDPGLAVEFHWVREDLSVATLDTIAIDSAAAPSSSSVGWHTYIPRV
jgi:hypothetical protein